MIVQTEEDALRFMEVEASCGTTAWCSEDCKAHGQHVATAEAFGKPFAYIRPQKEEA